MDFLNKAAQQLQSGQQHDEPSKQEKEEGVSGALGALNNVLSQQQKEGEQNPQASGLMGFVNNAMGGGSKGEAKEDNLDKAIDMFQEHVMKSGAQNNESAIEQAKDEQIANAIKGGWKQATGKDFPGQ